MEVRLRVPSLRVGWFTAVLILLLVGFLPLDKTLLHWYVPDTGQLRADMAAVDGDLRRLDSSADAMAGTISELKNQVGSDTTADLVNTVQMGQIFRLTDAVAVLSLVSAYGGFQSTVSPSGKACVAWLLRGEGSLTDCGFSHVESP